MAKLQVVMTVDTKDATLKLEVISDGNVLTSLEADGLLSDEEQDVVRRFVNVVNRIDAQVKHAVD